MISLDGVVAYVEYVKRVLLDIVIKALSISLVVSIASFTYGAFYYVYMPTQSYQLPLDLGFDPCSPLDQNVRNMHKCSFPSASVKMPTLTTGTHYSISADFVFQSPDATRSFMACISNVEGEREEVCRTVTLTAKTQYARFVDFVLVYPLEVLSHLLRHASISRASDSQELITVEFKAEHFPSSVLSGDNSHMVSLTVKTVAIEVISASLQIHKTKFNSLQSLMWYHPLVSETVAVIALSFAIILLSVYLWDWYTRPKSITDGRNVRKNVSKQDLARARLGKIDPKVVLTNLTSELIETSTANDQISLLGILSSFRRDGCLRDSGTAAVMNFQQRSVDSDESTGSDGMVRVGVMDEPDLVTENAIRKRNF